MLISFTVENFFSHKDESTISLVAASGKEMRDTHVFTPELKNKVKPFDLLRSAVIYGPNASGKSNFIDAFKIMKGIITDTNNEMFGIVPFFLSNKTNTEPSTFEVIMVVDGVRYQYGFSMTMERVYAEWLFTFPKGRTQTLFERDYNKKTDTYKYSFGDSLKGHKTVWQRATRNDALYLSTAVLLNSQQLQPIYDWFVKQVRYIGSDGVSQNNSLAYCQEHGNKAVVDFLKFADFAIEDIEIKENPDFAEKESLEERLAWFGATSDTFFEKKKGQKSLEAKMLHKTENGEFVSMPLHWESDGTRKALTLAAPFIEALTDGAILIVDELNQRLHPHLMQCMIELFNNPDTNPNNAQLIFTTHAVSLLKQDIFRRDQIWFCERETNQASNLFPLTDFKPRKGFEDFEAYYMSGRYGALPIIGDFSQALQNDGDK